MKIVHGQLFFVLNIHLKHAQLACTLARTYPNGQFPFQTAKSFHLENVPSESKRAIGLACAFRARRVGLCADPVEK